MNDHERESRSESVDRPVRFSLVVNGRRVLDRYSPATVAMRRPLHSLPYINWNAGSSRPGRKPVIPPS